ncbi:hypothetical protein NX059_001788 [Plenodomus lindquistii]|nr:hypothetical protein NX059_001788 [Plenodomus lindquistii]
MARFFVTRLFAGLVFAQLLGTTSLVQGQDISSSLSSTLATITAAPSSSASPTSSRAPKTHTITAGAGGFKFTPPEISNVSVGDVVNFHFYPPDHSVARADFGSACVPYEYTGQNRTGFWSTTQWVKEAKDMTQWNLTINSTEPIFFYCAAPNSCIGEHMVGVINPNDTQTLKMQQNAARDADFQVEPGQPIPAEAGTSTTFVNVPTAAPTPSTPPSSNNSSHKLSGGVIAGIVVGAVAFLVVCAALFYFVGRSKSLKENLKRNDPPANPATPDPHASMSQYGAGGLGSPGHPSTGYPSPGPYGSPGQSEYGFASPPMYGQHGAGEQYPSGWGTPPPGQQQQAHMSMMSGTSGLSQQQIDELKYARTSTQPALAELHSPELGQDGQIVEMDAEARK